jgi:hypothetical protein
VTDRPPLFQGKEMLEVRQHSLPTAGFGDGQASWDFSHTCRDAHETRSIP